MEKEVKTTHNQGESLILKAFDEKNGTELHLIYTLFEKENTITRRLWIKNNGEKEIEFSRCGSSLLNFEEEEVLLNGEKTGNGKRIFSSTGLFKKEEDSTSMLLEKENGESLLLDLLYSGPFEAVFRKKENQNTIYWGLNPDEHSFVLQKGETFETPEAVMSYGENRQDALKNYKKFIENILSHSIWQKRQRPLFFSLASTLGLNMEEAKILKYAKKAKELGAEGILIDDGWFGFRQDKKTGLGDWYVDTAKIPSGLMELT